MDLLFLSFSNFKLPFAKVPFDDSELFEVMRDGVLLSLFVNAIAQKNLIPRFVAKPTMTIYQRNENLDIVLKCSRTLGCNIVNIGPADISSGENHYLIMGLLWQLVNVYFNLFLIIFSLIKSVVLNKRSKF